MLSARTLSINGEQLRVTESGGDGKDLIVWIHSLGTHGGLWRAQMQQLTAYRHAAMDCRGHGGSSNHGGFSVAACAGDVSKAMDSLLAESPAERVHLVGISMGGLMACEVAALDAARARPHCASVTLACAYRRIPREVALSRIEATRLALHNQTMDEFAADYLQGTLTTALPPDVMDEMQAAIAGMTAADYLQTVQGIMTHDAGPALSSIRHPVHIIAGARDHKVPPNAVQDLQQAAPNASVTVIREAGHLANLEQATAFTQAVERFIATATRR